MGLSQEHNVIAPRPRRPRPFGVRVSLPPGDPFRKLLGAGWHRMHWYETAEERDRALAEMSRTHQYSRRGDRPALVFERVENLASSTARGGARASERPAQE